jgi:imidazolonepropionase-like amidohydrolase
MNKQQRFRVSTIFDGHEFRQGEYLLYVDNGSIAAWEELPKGVASLADAEDLRDSVLVPLLADAHIHASLAPWPLALEERKGMAEGDPLTAGLQRVETAIGSGVGWLRDGGDPKGVNLHVRSVLRDRATTGQPTPRYLVPGPAFHAPGRYGSFLGQALADREQMQQAMVQLKAIGADFVKILPTGIINFKTGSAAAPPQFSAEDMRYLVELCHENGWPVMAHASGAEGVRQAVSCGVDFVEHGYFIETETLEMMAEHNIAWTPTLAPVWVQMHHYQVCGWDATVRDGLERILEQHKESIHTARSLGIDILTGSDAGAPGVDQIGGIYLELSLLQEAGLSVPSLLRSSCMLTPQRLLGQAPSLWEQGSKARFIVAPRRVMQDITALLDSTSVVWDGNILPYVSPQVHPTQTLAVAQ